MRLKAKEYLEISPGYVLPSLPISLVIKSGIYTSYKAPVRVILDPVDNWYLKGSSDTALIEKSLFVFTGVLFSRDYLQFHIVDAEVAIALRGYFDTIAFHMKSTVIFNF